LLEAVLPPVIAASGKNLQQGSLQASQIIMLNLKKTKAKNIRNAKKVARFGKVYDIRYFRRVQ